MSSAVANNSYNNAQKLSEFTKVFTSSSKEPYDNSNQSYRQGDPIGPHYEVPNLASMLYEYTNKEQERIRQGFRIGNFISLRDLPHEINPGNVLMTQQQKIEGNLYGPMENRGAHVKTYVELSYAGGYFSKFDWKPEPFGLFLESQRKGNQEGRDKQLEVHGKVPFYSQPNIQLLPKHISAFQSTSGPDMQAASTFYGEDDPYEATKFEILREKWLSDSKILYGEFKPAHNSQNMKSVNKQHLPEIVGLVKRYLLSDWSDINFVIGTNPEDFIEMRFDAQSLDSPKGLHAYLNNLVNMNEMMLRYQLRRVTEYWGVFGDDGQHIYYMLAPPFIRIRNPTLYLKQIQNVSGGVSSEKQ
ncbi:UNKNOWN [Stylonychia lemnae]|uniref:Uncharacterized protein n=1 Tax=Stylonychia lemnae TaxID=5949 RepID=A0A078B8S8_STYLE|nr:UNKNOWN [Stylonychia lemnae]|eukprot:CDW90631.1 UNKNOWN [Stylonychia lemnae]